MMLADFKQSIKQSGYSMPIPKELLKVLSEEKTNGILQYTQINDGICVGYPPDLDLGYFNFRAQIPEHIRANNPDIKTTKDLMEYIYRTQQRLEIEECGDFIIKIKGVNINIKDMIQYPYSESNDKAKINKLIIEPHKFPELKPIQLKTGRYSYKFLMTRLPYDSMHIKKYEMNYKDIIKINVFCDERSEDIKFTFSIHETDDVHEKLKLYIFYNNLMTGDIKYGNKKIFPDNIKNEPIDEQLIKTLMYLDKIQKKLKIKFKLENKISKNDYVLVKSIYESLINNRPIREKVSIDTIKGIVNANTELDSEKWNGEIMSFSTITKEDISLYSTSFKLYALVLLYDVEVENIEFSDNSTFLIKAKKNSDTPSYIYQQYFMTQKEAINYESKSIEWPDKFKKNAQIIS